MSELYRTPDGKTTTSVKRYLKEWNALKKPLEKALDLESIGFDPGFLMRPKGGGNSVEIPTWMAKRIVALVRSNVELTGSAQLNALPKE